MAAREISGADSEEISQLREDYYNSPMFEATGIPFDTAFCLNPIAKQPDHYDGGQRYCKRRAAIKDPDDYEGTEKAAASRAVCCISHGGDVEKHGAKGGEMTKHHLEDPRTAAIKHGAHAEDEHLKMDFTEDEQELYDEIMEQWPEIYNWPDESEDPARYRILRRVAVNEVRAMREEDYIDNHEVHNEPVYDDQGVEIGHKEVENPLSREYRLLMSEVTDQMKELGLTPKERQKMDTLESEQSANDAVSEIASEALDSGDGEYDPDQFGDG